MEMLCTIIGAIVLFVVTVTAALLLVMCGAAEIYHCTRKRKLERQRAQIRNNNSRIL